MAKSLAQKALDEVITRSVLPALKPLGYRKTDHTFRHTSERCVRVVNVQASGSSSAHVASFTLNFGVYYPEVSTVGASFFRTTPGPGGPAVSECHLRARIGELLPGNGDRWWEIAANASLDAVTAEVDIAMRMHGLPWLESMADFDVARREAARQVGPHGIMFALAAGNRDEARALAAALLAERPQAAGFASWARSQGLIE